MFRSFQTLCQFVFLSFCEPLFSNYERYFLLLNLRVIYILSVKSKIFLTRSPISTLTRSRKFKRLIFALYTKLLISFQFCDTKIHRIWETHKNIAKSVVDEWSECFLKYHAANLNWKVVKIREYKEANVERLSSNCFSHALQSNLERLTILVELIAELQMHNN